MLRYIGKCTVHSNLDYLICFSAGKEEDSPIPLKATLARSATRRNTRKVPPISSTDKYISKDDDVDSAYAASLESTLEAESHSEVMYSNTHLHTG